MTNVTVGAGLSGDPGLPAPANHQPTLSRADFWAFVGMLALALLGVAISQADDKGRFLWLYWSSLVAVYGGISLVRAWLKAKRQGQCEWPMMRSEVFHWLGAFVAVNIVLLFEAVGITARGAASVYALLVLALSCYLAGVQFDWSYMLLGIILAVIAVAIGFLDQLSIFLLLLPVVLVSVWVVFRHKSVHGDSAPPPPSRPTMIQESTIMPEIEISPLPAQEVALFGDLKKNWGWLLAFGILSTALGTFGLGWTASTGLTLVTVLFFGWLLIIGGGFQLVDAFFCKGWKGILVQVLTALLYIVAGYLIVQDPLLASATFTLIIAAILIGVGVLRSFTAIQHRGSPGWVWALLGGLVSILLGAIIIAHWPVSGLWVIGLFVAIELLLNGWASIFVALAARRAAKADVALVA